jgi:hypothetical protein
MLALVVAVAALGSCRSDPVSTEIEPPPLFLRSSVPADSAQGVWLDEPFDVRLAFNRVVEPGELQLEVLPVLLDSEPPRLEGRFVEWAGWRLDPAVNAYRLLLDGPALPIPRLLIFHPGEPSQSYGRIYGDLRMPEPLETDDAAVLWALDPLREPIPGEPELLGLPVRSFDLAQLAAGAREVGFAVRHLAVGESYIVVAILDSSGNGIHDPAEDWWGYPHAPGSNVALSARADIPLLGAPGEIVIELMPPGSGGVEFFGR